MALSVLCRHLKCLKSSVRKYSKSKNDPPSKFSVPTIVKSHRDANFCDIIDVRTPDEFELDHIPGAINLPVLSNEERIEVGTLYKKKSFKARKIGAAMVTRNISQHLETYFHDKPNKYSPLVYCWRGGQRSYSVSLVLTQIGFNTCVLEGGYKQYRSQVQTELSNLPCEFQYKIISGLTGSGKTLILDALRSHGEQVLDLEALAKHKGSVLGLWHGETQPRQKYWESLIAHELHKFSPSRPVWVESESQRIGFITVPQILFDTMCQSPRYCIKLPLEERVKHCISSYPNWIENAEQLKVEVSKLVKVRGHKMVDLWKAQIDSGKWEDFVESILVEHYDPSYTMSQKKNNRVPESSQDVEVPDLAENTLDDLVLRLTGGDSDCDHLNQSTAS